MPAQLKNAYPLNIGQAEISKSRSKKKPFKVKIIAVNGEPTLSSQLLTTLLNCKKNIIASMNVFNGVKVFVIDKASKKERRYFLSPDGLEEDYPTSHI